jgi:hypothetical protein
MRAHVRLAVLLLFCNFVIDGVVSSWGQAYQAAVRGTSQFPLRKFHVFSGGIISVDIYYQKCYLWITTT